MPKTLKNSKQSTNGMKKHRVSEAEAFYIDAHLGKKTVAEIASDLGVTQAAVAAYVVARAAKATAEEPPPELTPTKSPAQRAGFGVNQEAGAVIMTERASVRGDESKKDAAVTGRVPDGVHVIHKD